MGYRFDPKCNHARESHRCQFFWFLFFVCHICRARVCWDPEILLLWQRDVTAFPLYSWHSDILLFLSKQVYFQNSPKTTICQKRREWGKEKMVPTRVLQSRHPDVTFLLSSVIPRDIFGIRLPVHTFNPESCPHFLLKFRI